MKESAGKKDSVEDTSSKKKFFHFMRSFGAKWLLLLCSKSNKRIVITKDFQETCKGPTIGQNIVVMKGKK